MSGSLSDDSLLSSRSAAAQQMSASANGSQSFCSFQVEHYTHQPMIVELVGGVPAANIGGQYYQRAFQVIEWHAMHHAAPSSLLPALPMSQPTRPGHPLSPIPNLEWQWLKIKLVDQKGKPAAVLEEYCQAFVNTHNLIREHLRAEKKRLSNRTSVGRSRRLTKPSHKRGGRQHKSEAILHAEARTAGQ